MGIMKKVLWIGGGFVAVAVIAGALENTPERRQERVLAALKARQEFQSDLNRARLTVFREGQAEVAKSLIPGISDADAEFMAAVAMFGELALTTPEARARLARLEAAARAANVLGTASK